MQSVDEEVHGDEGRGLPWWQVEEPTVQRVLKKAPVDNPQCHA